MTYRNASAPVRPASRTFAAIAKAAALGVALSLAAGSFAVAQQPAAPAPAAKPKPPVKKPAAPAPAAQAPAPAPEAQQPAPGPEGQAQGGQEQIHLIYSPWTKICAKDQGGKQICFTGKDARLESGMPVVAAAVVEQEGAPKKALRVTLPLHMLLQPGTRLIVDKGAPLTAPYIMCFEQGCVADYDATPDLIASLKKGQALYVQAIAQNQQPITLPLPLGGEFAKALDGPPTDPKVLEDQQKKLQDELQRRAEEARKQLEQQQGQPQSGAPAPAPAPAPQK
jgi:invasion protein IalB